MILITESQNNSFKLYDIFYRKGIVKFVRKKFPKKRREIEDLERRTVSVRKTSDLKVFLFII